jgi:serine O-acetyltransferase
VTPASGRLDGVAAWLLEQMERWRSLFALPLDQLYRVTDQQPVIDADVTRWADLLWVTDRSRMRVRLLYAFPQFRAVYYHRMRQGNALGALLGRLAAHLWRPTPGLDLADTRIGPGLFVSHGEATILSAERIGANLQVHQGVTIGWD